jgi:hypothetical protein
LACLNSKDSAKDFTDDRHAHDRALSR